MKERFKVDALPITKLGTIRKVGVMDLAMRTFGLGELEALFLGIQKLKCMTFEFRLLNRIL